MIKAVIFDWGGTCSGDIVKVFCKRLSVAVGIPPTRIKDVFDINNKKYVLNQISSDDFWDFFLSKLNIKKKKEVIGMFLEAAMADEKILGFIKLVKRGYKTALLSDNYNDVSGFIVKKYKLKKMFDAMVFSNEAGVKKPDKRIYLMVTKKLGLKPAECVFIDDKEVNVKGAEKVGIKGIHFKSLPKLRKDLKRLGIKL
jgi:putative hydrolase of the HAD superfamily